MEDIKQLDDYQLYQHFFTLKKQLQSDADEGIEGFGTDIKTRLFTANEHYSNILGLMKIEREMIARGLTP